MADDEDWGSADSDKYEKSGAAIFIDTTKGSGRQVTNIAAAKRTAASSSSKTAKKPSEFLEDFLDAVASEEGVLPGLCKTKTKKGPKKLKKNSLSSTSMTDLMPITPTERVPKKKGLKKVRRKSTKKSRMPPRPPTSTAPAGAFKVPKSLLASFTPQQLSTHETHFKGHADKKGLLPMTELRPLLASLGERLSVAKLDCCLKKLNISEQTISYQAFLTISSEVLTSAEAHGHTVRKDKEGNVHLTNDHGAKHQFSKEETAAFATHINHCLSHDKELLKMHLPLDPDSMDLFVHVRDGMLLAKLVNEAVPKTIDPRAINVPRKGKSLSIFEVKENQNLVIESAKAIGCKTTGVHNSSLIEGPRCPHLVLGLIWQIVKIQLMSVINLKQHPELVKLLKEGEDFAKLLKLSPEAILIRWVNYHMKEAGSDLKLKRSSFSKDICDSEIYTVLLAQIMPDDCDKKALAVPKKKTKTRAQHVLRNAVAIGVDPFIKPADIASGNTKLNYAFLAQIFNKHPGLSITEQEAFNAQEFMDEDSEGTREERVFRIWMNSLSIEGLFVTNLFEDSKNGLALLKVFDCVQPGCVDFKKKVNKRCKTIYQRIENTNYCLEVGKKLGFSLVGISGANITKGSHNLTLALVWQMLRLYQLNLLTRLGGGKKILEKNIKNWANSRTLANGGKRKMKHFGDKSLSNGLFLLDLVAAMEPRAVHKDLIKTGKTNQDKIDNANYIISCARKLGAVVFLTFEDIIEVKQKMILLLVASLMAVDMGFDEVDGAADDVDLADQSNCTDV